MKLFAILISILMVGCSPSIQMPGFTKQAPDVLTNDTNVVVNSGVVGTLSRGAVVQTEPENKPLVEATLAQSIKTVDGEIPKNTKITLPPNTVLMIKDPITVKLDEATDITLRKGTVVTISKINWYAILFYLLLSGGVATYWIYNRTKDKDDNHDGYVDEPKPQVLNESER